MTASRAVGNNRVMKQWEDGAADNHKCKKLLKNNATRFGELSKRIVLNRVNTYSDCPERIEEYRSASTVC
jgi:hypothetical protein